MYSFVDRSKNTELSFAELFTGIDGIRPAVAMVVLATLLFQGLAILQPLFLQLVIDDVLSNYELDLLAVLSIGFVLLIIMQFLIKTLRDLLILKTTSFVKLQMNTRVYNHLIRLSVSYFSDRKTGDIFTRFGGLNAVHKAVSSSLPLLITNVVVIVPIFLIMWSYNSLLAVVSFLVVLLQVAIRLRQYATLYSYGNESQVALSEMNSSFMETVRQIKVMKIFQMEDRRFSNWTDKYLAYLKYRNRYEGLNITTKNALDFVMGLDYIFSLYLGARYVLDGSLSPGMLLAFISFKTQFSNASKLILESVLQMRLLRVELDRLGDILLEHGQIDIFPSHKSPTLLNNKSKEKLVVS